MKKIFFSLLAAVSFLILVVFFYSWVATLNSLGETIQAVAQIRLKPESKTADDWWEKGDAEVEELGVGDSVDIKLNMSYINHTKYGKYLNTTFSSKATRDLESLKSCDSVACHSKSEFIVAVELAPEGFFEFNYYEDELKSSLVGQGKVEFTVTCICQN